MDYVFLADIVLITHFLFVLFILLGLLLIWIGGTLKWKWVRNFWFRAAHLVSILFVAVISFFGIPCPLTILEGNLRIASGVDFYDQSFIQHWLYKILFFEAPGVAFTIGYALFAVLVAVSFYFVPLSSPRETRKKR